MMNRREVLMAGAGALAATAATATQAGAAMHASKKHDAFARAAAECVRAGDECLHHCLDVLATGDKTLGACAHAVNEMLAVCRAVGTLAVADSKHLKTMAALCRDVCTDCEKACREHEKHHPECAWCAGACAAVIKEAAKLAA